MNKRVINIIAVVSAAAILVGIFAFIGAQNNSGISVKDAEKLIAEAKQLREKGDKDGAYYRLELYMSEKPANRDVLCTLAQWYKEDGENEKSDNYYVKATRAGDFSGYELSPVNPVNNFNCSSLGMTMEIKPIIGFTKDMKLYVCQENLANVDKLKGKIDHAKKDLIEDENSYTTDWFVVEGGTNVTLTGGFNCSRWQFLDDDGNITSYEDNKNFRVGTSVLFDSVTKSVVSIPKSCRKARVTYYDGSIENSAPSDGSIAVTYGKIFSGYAGVQGQEYDIPDLSGGQSVVYQDDKWYLIDGDKKDELDLPEIPSKKVMRMAIMGKICGTVNVNGESGKLEKGDKKAIYGVRYNTSTSNVVCMRTDDARGLNFDYKIGSEWVNGTGNDFDNAYPWCDIRLCNIYTTKAGKQNIFYEDSEYFALDGKYGNAMVEIPKFYTKRTVKDGVETISISGTKHSGFQLEPIFINSDGSEAEHVYMSAYFGAEKDGKIVSHAGTYPTLGVTYGNTLKMAEANGKGYSEVNFSMISALQKLFLIETGTLDASSVFGGDTTKLYYFNSSEEGRDTSAVESRDKSNTITLKNNFATARLEAGNSLIVFDGWKNYSNAKTVRREILAVRKNADGTLDVDFDGEPINIKKGDTRVSNSPEMTGKTNNLDYCTAMISGRNGKVSFRYRYIENLYGSAMVMLDDDAYARNGVFTYIDAQGSEHTIDAKLAVQTEFISEDAETNEKICIKTMSYDPDNPTVMVPTATGKGASPYSGYCDYWYYEGKNDSKKYYLFYGGAQDNSRIAGPFQLRANIDSENVLGFFHSARIMYRR